MWIRSFSLRFFLTIIAALTFLAFATVAIAEKGSDKGPRLSDKSVVALKALDVGGVISVAQAPDDIGAISLIPKEDGVIVAADPMATDPQRGKKVIYLTNTITIPATKGDAIGHYMITNSRPTWRLDFAHYRTGFPLRT